MKLKNHDLNILCELAKKAAKEAGIIISKASLSPVKLKKKAGGENLASCVVTEIDLASEKKILEILNESIQKYDLGILAEESTDNNSRFEKDYFWCIDPLDGTLAFSQNEDGYSVSIALVSQEGRSIIGVVYDPKADTLYHAIKDQGAYKNNRSFKPSSPKELLTIFFDQSFLKIENYDQEIKMLKEKAQDMELQGLKLSPLGGAVMNAISTIEMHPAIYYKHPKIALGGGSIWDFAASSIIHSEALGFNSDYYGEPLHLNQRESTFMNTNGVCFSSFKYLS